LASTGTASPEHVIFDATGMWPGTVSI
jgi:hypothetical protein